MKKRHLFLAMALPAVFAACTQDDFVSENTQGSAQQGIKSQGRLLRVLLLRGLRGSLP